jgi:hypothetical protein
MMIVRRMSKAVVVRLARQPRSDEQPPQPHRMLSGTTVVAAAATPPHLRYLLAP